ncbi:MAG: hypothetical protein Q8R82_18845 [Hyphomonadaceae bacterium]|nr:hypothetical protein [Hyphomonadaceae bacterium]
MSDRKSDTTHAPRAERPPTAAQRASEANRAQQIAVHESRSQHAERRPAPSAETPDSGV